MNKKETKKFTKLVKEYLHSIGAKQLEDSTKFHRFQLETKAGTNIINLPFPEEQKHVFSVFTRFENAKKAFELVKWSNKYSGKYNYYTSVTDGTKAAKGFELMFNDII